ncbi:MAG: PqqD family protein, partial [Planctomycetaceae bacterium]
MTMSPLQTDSAEARPVRLRRRGDLEAHPRRFGRERCWIIKDPVSLRYYQLREEEYAVLNLLDGRRSLDDIRTEFEAGFTPMQLPPEQLQAFLGVLHRNGLIVADAAGQGERLLHRRDEQRRRAMWGRLANVLAIRFRGIDPDPFLKHLEPACRWMFSPLTVFLCLALVLAAVLLATVQF